MKRSGIKNQKYYVTDQIKIRSHQEVFNRLFEIENLNCTSSKNKDYKNASRQRIYFKKENLQVKS